MTQKNQTRREKLEAFVAANPNDSFARYGLAMECVRAGEADVAAGHFRDLLKTNPQYVPGYFHYAQLLISIGKSRDAQGIFEAGVAAARAAGNAHALDEMQAALDELLQRLQSTDSHAR